MTFRNYFQRDPEMKNQIKFSEIKTVAELKTRATQTQYGQLLRCGNRYWLIRHLLELTGAETDRVVVSYTAGSGSHSIVRYFKAD